MNMYELISSAHARGVSSGIVIAFVCVTLSAPAPGGTVTRVSVASDGTQADRPSYGRAMSFDARFVVFSSQARNLVPNDAQLYSDVFVYDTFSRVQSCVSVTAAGLPGTGQSQGGAISADGRYVAFSSDAPDLVAGDTNNRTDVFVRDRDAGTTERVSVSTTGTAGDGWSVTPSISADGRFVAFESSSSNLVPGITGRQIYRHDRATAATILVSALPDGSPSSGGCASPSISANGRYVAFSSYAQNLAPDGRAIEQVYVRDLVTGTLTCASVSQAGTPAAAPCTQPQISSDGRIVAFVSSAANLVAGDTNNRRDVFVRDTRAAQIERASVDWMGAQIDHPFEYTAPQSTVLSGDGRFVAFATDAQQVVPGEPGREAQAYVRDRVAGQTRRVSVNDAGARLSPGSLVAAISTDGRFVCLTSDATNAVEGDTNRCTDIFLRDRCGPVISVNLANQIVCNNADATFTLVIDAADPVEIQWRRNGLPLDAASSETLTLSAVDAADAGTYDAVISDNCGSITTTAAMLDVSSSLPIIVVQPQDTIADVEGAAQLHVQSPGPTPLQFQWRRNGAALVNDGRIRGATSALLRIESVNLADAGSYDVLLTNPCAGTISSAPAVLTVLDSPRGDLDCDGRVTNFDVDGFVAVITDVELYESMYPNCDWHNADANMDGQVDLFDIDAFVSLLFGGPG